MPDWKGRQPIRHHSGAVWYRPAMPNADPVTPDQVVQRSVRFPTDIADALAARAARERRSVNSLIVVAVEAYLRAAAA